MYTQQKKGSLCPYLYSSNFSRIDTSKKNNQVVPHIVQRGLGALEHKERPTYYNHSLSNNLQNTETIVPVPIYPHKQHAHIATIQQQHATIKEIRIDDIDAGAKSHARFDQKGDQNTQQHQTASQKRATVWLPFYGDTKHD